MNIPGYDDYILRGPDEPDEPKMEPCPVCTGHNMAARWICDECHGKGEVEADAEEYETERGEWLRDRRDGL